MFIKNPLLVWGSAALMLFGLVCGFLPPVTALLATVPFIKVGIVLAFIPILWLWVQGMRTGTAGAWGLAAGLVPVLLLRASLETGMPTATSLELAGGMLAVSGMFLLLIFGLGYGRRPQTA